MSCCFTFLHKDFRFTCCFFKICWCFDNAGPRPDWAVSQSFLQRPPTCHQGPSPIFWVLSSFPICLLRPNLKPSHTKFQLQSTTFSSTSYRLSFWKRSGSESKGTTGHLHILGNRKQMRERVTQRSPLGAPKTTENKQMTFGMLPASLFSCLRIGKWEFKTILTVNSPTDSTPGSRHGQVRSPSALNMTTGNLYTTSSEHQILRYGKKLYLKMEVIVSFFLIFWSANHSKLSTASIPGLFVRWISEYSPRMGPQWLTGCLSQPHVNIHQLKCHTYLSESREEDFEKKMLTIL